MERVFIVGLGLAGQLTAASIVVAAKGLLRWPELQSKARAGVDPPADRVLPGRQLRQLAGGAVLAGPAGALRRSSAGFARTEICWRRVRRRGPARGRFVEAELNRASRAAPSGAPTTRRACAPPGPRSSAPGRQRSSVSRRCRPARSTCPWPASGRSPRRCATSCWPRTRGWRRAVLEMEQPFHPIGLAGRRARRRGHRHRRSSRRTTPSYADVLEVRAGRVALVRDYLASVTADQFGEQRTGPARPRASRRPPVVPARDPRGGVGAPPLRREATCEAIEGQVGV